MSSSDDTDRQPAADRSLSQDIPAHPKLRPVEPQLVEHQGQRFVYLRERLGLTAKTVLVPQAMAPLLALCDGSRDVRTLQAALALRTGVLLTTTQIQEFVRELDAAFLLENGAYRRASAEALRAYREADSRKPAQADLVYPSDPEALASAIEEYCDAAPPAGDPLPASADLVGVVSPHIDYQRGGKTYAQLWRKCAAALEDVELAIIFGTDHAGGPVALTLTHQSYATPLGVLPTERAIVDGLADALGHEAAFAEELHHKNEHSIELAAVWLHHFIGGRACPLVPVLCGSFQQFIEAGEDPSQSEAIAAAVEVLRIQTAGRRTLVIASGDLAHVGPAFGDAAAVDPVGRARVAAEDARSIAAICNGDASEFFALSRAEADARKLCGLPPIYMALRTLGAVKGEPLGYAQCPGDMDGKSLVSIVGVLLYGDT